MLDALAHPHVLAIGETGLDYHYRPQDAEQQQAAFRLHLEAAQLTGKPVVVHTREAREDTLRCLREAALPQAGVLHCFTEDWAMARQFIISRLSGIVTFRNADALREVPPQPMWVERPGVEEGMRKGRGRGTRVRGACEQTGRPQAWRRDAKKPDLRKSEDSGEERGNRGGHY